MESLSFFLMMKDRTHLWVNLKRREMPLRCVLNWTKAWKTFFRRWWTWSHGSLSPRVSMRQNAKIEIINKEEEEQSICRKGLWMCLHVRAEYWPNLEVHGTQCVRSSTPGRKEYRPLSMKRANGPLREDDCIKGGRWWCLVSFAGNHTLQVTVQSQYNQGIFMDGCWVFTIDRQYPFYFYPKIMTWRESHPDASRTVSQWQNNRQVAQSLRTCSMGDFSQCLRKLLTDSREVPSK